MQTDKKLMLVCMSNGLLSSCKKRQVGAIFVLGGEIIGTGYNQKRGVACRHAGICTSGFTHHCDKTVHAELVAMEHAMPRIRLERRYNPDFSVKMYISISPCPDCAVRLREIEELDAIYYGSPYKEFERSKELLAEYNISLIRVDIDEEFVHENIIERMVGNKGKVCS